MCIRNGASGLSFSLRHGREEFQYQDDKAWCHRWVTARRPLRQCWQVVLSFGGALAKDPQAADNICVCRGVSFVTGESCAEFGSRTGLQQPEDVECVLVHDPLEIAATGVIETVADLDGLGDQERGWSGDTDLMGSGV